MIINSPKRNKNYNTLRIPVILRYSIPTPHFKLNLDAGANNIFMTGNDIHLTEVDDWGTVYSSDFKSQRYNLGYTVGSGISYGLSKSVMLNINAEYYMGYPVLNFELEKLRTHAFEVHLGIEYSSGK